MVEDAPGLDLLVKAGVLDEGGAGLPLARHLLGLPPPSPHAEGEGHEQEVDVSVFDLATRMHKLDTCYEWAAESKTHAEDLLFGARPRVIWWWQRSRAQHSYPLEHAFLSADTCVHAFHIERAVCEKLCLILDDPKNYNSEKALCLHIVCPQLVARRAHGEFGMAGAARGLALCCLRVGAVVLFRTKECRRR